MNKLSVLGIIGGAALLTAAPFSLQWSQEKVALSLDSADARIGRPRTALSVAGVHRRAYRRTARAAVYAGAAGVGYGAYSGYGYPAYSGYYAPQTYSYAPQSYSSYYAPQSYYGGYGYPSYSSYYAPRPYLGFSVGWRRW